MTTSATTATTYQVRSQVLDMVGFDSLGAGQNAIIAVMSYSGAYHHQTNERDSLARFLADSLTRSLTHARMYARTHARTHVSTLTHVCCWLVGNYPCPPGVVYDMCVCIDVR